MKEATGELNVTVIVVVMIGILVSFFFFTFWPMIQDNMNKTSSCSKAICPCKKGNPETSGVCTDCYVVDSKTRQKVGNEFECSWKG